jgi:hypothetical protein
VEEIMPAEGERFEGSEPQTTQPPMAISSSVGRRSTGPRTRLGKEKSKRNSLKHGIFSEAVVLTTESRAEYQSLWKQLHKDIKPVGAVEEVLVEKLTVLLWRMRRLYVAEGAEIPAASEFVEWDERQRQSAEAGRISHVQYNGGLIRRKQNVEALQRCLDLLAELKANISTNGFHFEDDSSILKKLYGDVQSNHWENNLLSTYLEWYGLAVLPDIRREQMEVPSVEECHQRFLEELDAEMKRVEKYQMEQASIESRRMKIESLRHSVPDTPGLDRLLKYEIGLERAADRVLNQIERRQRMRLGEPIDVNVSSSYGSV